MLVQPVDEECVRYFELDDLGGKQPRHDGLEPGIEGLRAPDPLADGVENLSPEEADVPGLHGTDGHFQRSLAEKCPGFIHRVRGGENIVPSRPRALQTVGFGYRTSQLSTTIVTTGSDCQASACASDHPPSSTLDKHLVRGPFRRPRGTTRPRGGAASERPFALAVRRVWVGLPDDRSGGRNRTAFRGSDRLAPGNTADKGRIALGERAA